MCRLAAYTGSELLLESFLLEPRHSLYRQSWQPREMHEAVVNADGFGFGWYKGQDAQCYLSEKPVWSDVNLPVLARCLKSKAWAANVRSATPGQAVHQLNCQPFTAGDWLFLHNGFIENFHPGGREIMLRLLPAATVAKLRGSTDSAFICALLEQELQEAGSPDKALANVAAMAGRHLEGKKVMLNIIICRPGQIYALRHSVSEHCASLYNCYDSEAFPGAHLCVSENFDDSDSWQQVPEHSLLKCLGDSSPEYVALARM